MNLFSLTPPQSTHTSCTREDTYVFVLCIRITPSLVVPKISILHMLSTPCFFPPSAYPTSYVHTFPSINLIPRFTTV